MSPLLLAAALVLGQLAGAKAPDAPPDAAALETMARGILSRVEAMRGQKLHKPLKMGVKSKADVTRFIKERMDEEYGPEKVASEGRLLRILGLLPADLDYGAFLTSLLTEQVAGFYDQTRKELHIAAWLPPLLQEPVLAHEIFHAIQDQEWGGGDLIDAKKYTHDAVLAHAALLEGDATVVMFNYQQRKMGDASADVTTSAFTVNMIATSIPLQMATPQFPVMASAPDYLKQSLVFPYQYGLLFVAGLRQGGMSWDAVRKVYADPPETTEQILHPTKYAPQRDAPSPVKFPVLVPGFRRTWEGVGGEFHLRQVLMAQLPLADATDAAAGWDGDYTVLEVDGDKAYVAAAITWDTPDDATQFEKALVAAHAKRPAPRPELVESRNGTETYFTLSTDATLAKQAHDALVKQTQVTRR